jgi:hypothetical protein
VPPIDADIVLQLSGLQNLQHVAASKLKKRALS